MKLIRLGLSLCICIVLDGCLYGQCINGPCSFEREKRISSIKAYGEHWTKPGMTKESWLTDWVACGGMNNGQYSGDAPNGSTTREIIASQQTARKKIDACMQSKGYEFH